MDRYTVTDNVGERTIDRLGHLCRIVEIQRREPAVKHITMKSIEIITLYYSEQINEFFPNPMDSKRNVPVGAKVIARQIDSRDAEIFISRMHTKYVKGPSKGDFRLWR